MPKGKKRNPSIPRNLGWKLEPKSSIRHFYRARGNSDLAMSLCWVVANKTQLTKATGTPMCPVCKTIRKNPLVKGGERS